MVVWNCLFHLNSFKNISVLLLEDECLVTKKLKKASLFNEISSHFIKY